jgi:uncharacterized protein (TIGR02147 family)
MSIFDKNNYRAIFEERLKKLPKSGRGVKAQLAAYLNINSTMISQILSGNKDFSIEQAQKAAEFLGLSKLEMDYFITLVQIERAGNVDLKKYFSEKKEALKKESLKLSKRLGADIALTDLERSIFYSSKLYSSIHLFTSLEGGKSIDEITKRFALKRTRAMEVISFLLSAGLISEHDGKYSMEGKTTHVEKGSPFLLNHHTNWRVLAIEKAESITEDEMMYTGNFSLSKKDFLVIREELVATLQKVVKTVQDSPAEDLANLNIDLFWM